MTNDNDYEASDFKKDLVKVCKSDSSAGLSGKEVQRKIFLVKANCDRDFIWDSLTDNLIDLKDSEIKEITSEELELIKNVFKHRLEDIEMFIDDDDKELAEYYKMEKALLKKLSSLDTEKDDVNESGFALGGEQSEKNTETSQSEMSKDKSSLNACSLERENACLAPKEKRNSRDKI